MAASRRAAFQLRLPEDFTIQNRTRWKPACRNLQFLYYLVALMTPEDQARQRIDEMLTASGWVIHEDRQDLNAH